MERPDETVRRRLAALTPERRSALMERIRRERVSAPARPGPRDILTPFRLEGSRPPLFLVHPSGGSTAPYLPLVRSLGEDQPCVGIDAVGLDGTPPLTSVADMAERYREAVRSVRPHGPYHLAGWSVGGGLAHALATCLRARGEQVALLVLLDAPEPPLLAAPPDTADVLALFAENLALTAGSVPPSVSAGELRGLPYEAQVSTVLRRLADAGSAPAGAEEFVRARMAVFEAALVAGALWRPERYDGRVDLVRAEEGHAGDETARGWSAWTSEAVVTHRVPGDHYSMVRFPQVERLAAILRQQLDRVL